jgi:glyoxylase-like metal-dependent hydrolase (beta-lactamase superfamily II)
MNLGATAGFLSQFVRLPVMHRIRVAVADSDRTYNAYLLPERGVLVDPGPAGDHPWESLVAGIRDTGVAVEDVDHVLLTHWHADHVGLAPRLADEADARVVVHEADAPMLDGDADARANRWERARTLFAAWGMPDAVVERVLDVDRARTLPTIPDVEPCGGGTVADGVEVIPTPGHTAGHVAFAADGDVLLGDAVLPDVSPNVGGTDTRLSGALAGFLAALGELGERDGRAYPGHGEPFDLQPRVAELIDHHATRARRAHEVAVEHGPVTPWTTAEHLFGEVEGMHAKLGTGEAASHLAFLHEAGLVERVDGDPVCYDAEPGCDPERPVHEAASR